MIKSNFGISKEPFTHDCQALLPQQEKAIEIIRAHSLHGGSTVITGEPGVGKTVLRQHIEGFSKTENTLSTSFSRTMHTYQNILKQLAESMQIESSPRKLEKDIIQTVFKHARENKILYTLIDEAHLLDLENLRKLRLLFDQFPKKHNLVLFGQPILMLNLSMNINSDIKSRITYSQHFKAMNENDLSSFVTTELERVGLGINTFDESALQLIFRNAQGNLRLLCNLCYGSLLEACRERKQQVSISHDNNILIQPHWRSHEDLI